jgi:hypothetical protein
VHHGRGELAGAQVVTTIRPDVTIAPLTRGRVAFGTHFEQTFPFWILDFGFWIAFQIACKTAFWIASEIACKTAFWIAFQIAFKAAFWIAFQIACKTAFWIAFEITFEIAFGIGECTGE